MAYNLTGKITKVLEVQSGMSKADKPWQKQSIIIETSDQYNNLYCLELFGAEKVESFGQRFNIGDEVKVDFNISVNEWKDKYFTSLTVWQIDGVANIAPPQNEAPPTGATNEMPF